MFDDIPKEEIKQYEACMKRYLRCNLDLKLTPKVAMKICNASWGYDAVNTALNYTSNKLDSYDGYGDYFDVSYQGSLKELRDDLLSVLVSAGLDAKSVGDNKIEYDNEGTTVEIDIYKLPEGEDYTFTENSTGYGIEVSEIY